MIVTELKGGMGNQMFQYALARNLSLKHDSQVLLDSRFLLDRSKRPPGFVFRDYDLGIFNIEENFAPKEISAAYSLARPKLTKGWQRLFPPGKLKTVFEQTFRFDPAILNAGDNIYLSGYWQTEKYFKDIAPQIRRDFTFRNPPSAAALQLAERIRSSNAVCINVRRGDFVSNPTHGTLGMEYYEVAEKIIREKVKDPQLFVFSDEIDWCMEHMHFDSPVIFVGHEYAGEKFRDYLWLMTLCDHFIIPNSSFAWWAAWLCGKEDKTVIAPSKWFHNEWDTSDILPSNWIKL